MDEKSDSQGPLIPRLTFSYLESLIVSEDYHHFPSTGTTVCCIKVTNGFTITTEASCSSAYHFDFEIGKQKARRKALKKLMEKEQYLLRQRLYEARLAREDNI